MKPQNSKIIRFLLENGDNISMLKSLITFLPGRYGDSELLSEGIYSIANIFQSYLDYMSSGILMSNNCGKTSTGEIIPPPYYLSTLRWITTVQNLELFIEIFASKKSGKKVAIFIIELLKAILRLKLLIKTNGNMLVHHSFYVPSKDVKAIFEKNKNNQNVNFRRSAVTISLDSNSNDNNSNNNENNGITKRKTLSDQILEQQIQQQNIMNENNLFIQQQRETQQNEESTLIKLLPPSVPKDYSTKVVGEVLFIIRPVVYWVSYCIFGKKSWKPWFLSLVTEALSKTFSEYGHFTNKIPLSRLESKELNRRRTLFLFYLIRSPFYEKFIGDGLVLKVFTFFKKIPIFKTVIDILINYLNVYRTRYFYTSAS